jgi:hypothetical protein
MKFETLTYKHLSRNQGQGLQKEPRGKRILSRQIH